MILQDSRDSFKEAFPKDSQLENMKQNIINAGPRQYILFLLHTQEDLDFLREENASNIKTTSPHLADSDFKIVH